MNEDAFDMYEYEDVWLGWDPDKDDFHFVPLIQLKNALSRNETIIRSIEFNGYRSDATGIAELWPALSTNTTLRSLHVQEYDTQELGLDILCQALKANTHLQYLGFYCNELPEGGIFPIAELLESTKTLLRLTIDFFILSISIIVYG